MSIKGFLLATLLLVMLAMGQCMYIQYMNPIPSDTLQVAYTLIMLLVTASFLCSGLGIFRFLADAQQNEDFALGIRSVVALCVSAAATVFVWYTIVFRSFEDAYFSAAVIDVALILIALFSAFRDATRGARKKDRLRGRSRQNVSSRLPP